MIENMGLLLHIFWSLWTAEASEGIRIKVLIRYIYLHIRFIFTNNIVFDWERSIKLKVVKHRASSTNCYYFGKYDFSEMSFLEKFLRVGDIVVDVGSNIGSYALFSAACGAEAIAIEPEPSTFALLKENIELNSNLIPHIKPIQCAVGDEDGEVKFMLGNDTTNRIITGEQSGGETIKVICKCLDDIIDMCDVLTIDVENYELQALRGSDRLLSSEHCNVVIIEAFEDGEKIQKILKKYGFNSYRYDSENNKLLLCNKRYRSNNVLFVKNLDYVEARINNCEKSVVSY